MNPRPIVPIGHPLRAQVRVPGSKSLTNRALAVAALADGETRLVNALVSDDARYFVQALAALGFAVETTLQAAPGQPDAAEYLVHGLGGRIPAAKADLFIGNAGTAARFLTALVALGHGDYLIDGEPRMRERPIADLLAALNALGAQAESTAGTGCPPVRVRAAGLPGGTASVRGDLSSQYLSALLMAAPRAQNAVTITIAGELNSKPYVDMTLAVMGDFGVPVQREGYARFQIAPTPYAAQRRYVIESDASAASYFLAAPAIVGGAVRVQNISRQSRQGDSGFVNVLAQMGCAVREGPDWLEVEGPPPSQALRGVDVDLRDMPDTAQTLAAAAPFASTPTTIRGIASARVKETDRVAAMAAELARLGVAVEEREDGLTIQPAREIRPAVVQTYNDHRMAMAFALVGLRAEGVQIENPGCVSKTFPGYFEVLEGLRE